MYTISKEFSFSASHKLNHLPSNHPCHNLHGHNYIVIVILQSEKLDENFFVRDYRELSILKKFIDDNWDHKHLNDEVDFPTTVENLTKYLFDFCKKHWKETVAVKISETPKTLAVYSESGIFH